MLPPRASWLQPLVRTLQLSSRGESFFFLVSGQPSLSYGNLSKSVINRKTVVVGHGLRDGRRFALEHAYVVFGNLIFKKLGKVASSCFVKEGT